MPTNRLIKPFESHLVILIFIFSTIYTLYYYYELGLNQLPAVNALGDKPNVPVMAGLLAANPALEALSLMSPFFVIKGIIFVISPSDLYTFLNLLILRPVGWISAIFFANYVVSKIPTVSSE